MWNRWHKGWMHNSALLWEGGHVGGGGSTGEGFRRGWAGGCCVSFAFSGQRCKAAMIILASVDKQGSTRQIAVPLCLSTTTLAPSEARPIYRILKCACSHLTTRNLKHSDIVNLSTTTSVSWWDICTCWSLALLDRSWTPCNLDTCIKDPRRGRMLKQRTATRGRFHYGKWSHFVVVLSSYSTANLRLY